MDRKRPRLRRPEGVRKGSVFSLVDTRRVESLIPSGWKTREYNRLKAYVTRRVSSSGDLLLLSDSTRARLGLTLGDSAGQNPEASGGMAAQVVK